MLIKSLSLAFGWTYLDLHDLSQMFLKRFKLSYEAKLHVKSASAKRQDYPFFTVLPTTKISR